MSAQDVWEIDFNLAGFKADDTPFTDDDFERLLDTFVDWAEAQGLCVGGGFSPLNKNGNRFKKLVEVRSVRAAGERLAQALETRGCEWVLPPVVKDTCIERQRLYTNPEPHCPTCAALRAWREANATSG